ncbi:MAG: S-adenosyl-l-methionine hydroxide adenosyltransferase family protein [Candidatus Hadarchaeales archaeon]
MGEKSVEKLKRRVIALLSDLGTRDYFVGAMKGVILSIAPRAVIVDITHDIPKFEVAGAGFVLLQAARYFPPETIFVVVVDPGVGGKRKCLLLTTKNGQMFIAPDNGVLTLVAETFGVKEIREITNRRFMLPKISSTFHGRDVMAPVAAWLASGKLPSEVGRIVKEMVRIKFPVAAARGGTLRGGVIYVDDFGNIITNIPKELVKFSLGERLTLRVGRKKISCIFGEKFSDVPAGGLICYIGSAGTVEIAENLGSAQERLRIKTRERIIIEGSRCREEH